MSDNLPCLILVEPQLAENVGMAARAMMNCGLYRMRLVNPREDHLSAKAIAASSNAEEILYQAEVFATTREAIADLQTVYATTARRRDQTKTVKTAEDAALEMNRQGSAGLRCGVLFGPERSGLVNEDVSLADVIINIPLNPKHCSLNLSQAVLLVGYEIFKTVCESSEPKLETNRSTIAEKEKVLRLADFIDRQVQDCGNWKIDGQRDKLAINLRNIFTRSQLTDQEVNTFYGIINHLSQKPKV